MVIKVLNLYAGIGGNRKLWPDSDIEVTAVEYEPTIAGIYKHFYPNDKVIIGDAHQYLLDNYDKFDFIWSSPPCPTHSDLTRLNIIQDRNKAVYPEMSLYQEIIFLQWFCKCKWVVENVIGYYEPLIKPYISGSHYFWSNFNIPNYKLNSKRAVTLNTIKEKQNLLGFDLEMFDLTELKINHRKEKLLNNCVEPKLGLSIFNSAFKTKQVLISELY